MKKLLSVMLSFVMVFCLVACQDSGTTEKTDGNTQQTETAGLWTTATYTEDTEIGEGANTVALAVTAEEKTITLTLHTDEATLGGALVALEIVEGTVGDYGLYISHVNGIKAVYEEDNAYWALLDGEGNYTTYGVDQAELSGNDSYRLVYTPA